MVEGVECGSKARDSFCVTLPADEDFICLLYCYRAGIDLLLCSLFVTVQMLSINYCTHCPFGVDVCKWPRVGPRSLKGRAGSAECFPYTHDC